ncbi:MAG: energy-coupling factor transporter transmembrane protein EcfT [Clostridia bacterium]|nr:energy-coupling factor transporter transmembrane protein EcfT [Clostridia bacterium]
MLKDITLGQYFPGTSPLHKLDPRMKIILTVIYIVDILFASNIWSFLLVSLFTVGLVLISTIPPKIVIKGLKPLIFIIAFTVIFNIFWTEGDHLLLSAGPVKIYLEGIMYAIFMIVRVVALLAGTCVVLTYTTSPIALTDGLEQLLSPLKKLRLPVHEFSMMMTIALRFIPTLVEETDKIMSAQKARGADFESGSLISRAKALVPILIPLFVSAFRRADDLAVAMECRCYRGGEGRSKMTALHFTGRDFLWLGIFLLFGAAVILINRFAPGISL